MTKTAIVVGLAVVAASAVAQGQQGPAMNSFFLNVKPTDGECCANVTFVQKLPPERKLPVQGVTMSRIAKGKYLITAPGAAPFPTAPPRAGFFTAVTAVASNAHCFEENTLMRGTKDLVSTVGCVDPKGARIDSEFSWSYRADSLEFVQFTTMPANFAYAQVMPDLQLGAFFNPGNGNPAKGGAVTATQVGTGPVKVKFAGLGTTNGGMDRKGAAHAIVSNICAGDAPCGTNVCFPVAWSVGATASTVDVQCHDAKGAPVSAAFRVFLGQEALNSQAFGKFAVKADYKRLGQHYNEGTNFGWVSSSEMGAADAQNPIAKPDIVYLNKGKDFPGPRKIDYFHLGPGKYKVRFKDQIIYGQTYWSMHATTRDVEGGAYCNVGDIDFHTLDVGVSCYDGTGAPRDSKWVLSMRRLYN